jgi:type I restriction enzyme S subunit
MISRATAHLGDAASFIRGITFKPGDVVPVGSSGSVACMRTKNVQTELDLSDVWGIPESFVKRDDQFLAAGDLLVSSANSWNLVGKCCWVPELPWRATFGGFISVLRGDPAKIEPRYLYHWFSSPRIQATVRSFGQQTTNISNLNIDRCLRLPLSLPPLPEQRRIATIVDMAGALRAKRRASLAKLDQLTQFIFVDMFGDPATNPKGWDASTIGDISEKVTDGEHLTPKREASGIKLLSARNIRDGWIDFSQVDYVGSEEYARIAKRCDPRRGDVLISCSGTVGRVASVETDEPFALVRSAAMVRPKQGRVRTKFLELYLRMPAMRMQMLRKANASSQANLFQGQIRDLPALVPPLSLQDSFDKKVACVESLKMTLSASDEELTSLFESIRERAFEGEL